MAPSRRLLWWMPVIAGWVLASAHAGEWCPPPQGRVLLRIWQGPDPVAACDLQGLEQLPQRDIHTHLPPELGLQGKHHWRGVPLSQLAARAGAGPQTTVQLTALNQYAVTVPMSDLLRYDPILALRRDGETMPVREKGPLILIYPFDQHRELDALTYLNRSIWQVNEVRFLPH